MGRAQLPDQILWRHLRRPGVALAVPGRRAVEGQTERVQQGALARAGPPGESEDGAAPQEIPLQATLWTSSPKALV